MVVSPGQSLFQRSGFSHCPGSVDHPGARRAGCEQHTETGDVMRTRWCISDVVAVAVLIICAAVVITLIIRH
ncbi:hypothetical protein Sgleb_65220 [Streptomyces glebosus]|uniref:Uncharacterized protein n=1 Tax=Streptomyces glebosus TaxID=249580 RepID=A0A640T9Y3_9ACTN|nr:hypothetical protein Sgleb_65220 [Streptomyces glebosus]GHG58942.1 hypothetical protein GCM10010513_23450 [Streptomyces glebosus]